MNKELKLPQDLVTFLNKGKQLEYDPSKTFFSSLKLKKLEELALIKIHVTTDIGFFDNELDDAYEVFEGKKKLKTPIILLTHINSCFMIPIKSDLLTKTTTKKLCPHHENNKSTSQ